FRDGPVKDYALMGLACVGDDRGWEDVRLRLVHLLRNPPSVKSEPSSVRVALAYLGQFAKTPEATSSVGDIVRRRWDVLDRTERDWIEAYWPSLTSGLPSAPRESDRTRMRHWARNHLPWRPFLRTDAKA